MAVQLPVLEGQFVARAVCLWDLFVLLLVVQVTDWESQNPALFAKQESLLQEDLYIFHSVEAEYMR